MDKAKARQRITALLQDINAIRKVADMPHLTLYTSDWAPNVTVHGDDTPDGAEWSEPYGDENRPQKEARWPVNGIEWCAVVRVGGGNQ